jgi:hypothetical protein
MDKPGPDADAVEQDEAEENGSKLPPDHELADAPFRPQHFVDETSGHGEIER